MTADPWCLPSSMPVVPQSVRSSVTRCRNCRPSSAARANACISCPSRIDPEQDSPARLRELAKTYGAGPEWQYYTGTLTASETAQRAFDVYRGAKMDHSPVTLIRPTPEGPWVRLDGFTTASQLFAELPDLNNLRAAR